MWSMFLAKSRGIAAGSKCIPWRLLSAQVLRRVHTHAPVSPFPHKQSDFVNQARPLPTKSDVACKNAAHKCLAVGRKVGCSTVTLNFDRSIYRRRIGFQLLGRPRVHGLYGAATRHASALPWNYDTNRRPRTDFLNAQKPSIIRTCDVRQIALKLQLQRQRRVSLSGPPPSKSA